MKTRHIGLLVLAALAALLIFRSLVTQNPSPPAATTAVPENVSPQPDSASPAGLTILSGTEMDTLYGSPSSSPARDLEILRQTLDAAMILVKNHRELPIADNADFVKFLSGNNNHRVAWIRPGHPMLNINGELLDRWKQPVFFHRESATNTTLRSAGPDRTLWTDDDVIDQILPE